MKGLRMAIPLCLVCVLLCACKPAGVTTKTYDAAKQMVDVMDQYLDLKITADDAYNMAERCFQHIDANDWEQSEGRRILNEMNMISTFTMKDLADEKPGSELEVSEARNRLACLINLSER